ncbi:ethanolamine utilization protein EutH [Acinetobacter pittii]|uniref:ethanolamine utilization protein EutH n=1 Tax=Acinetobacter pittii TaxID=48296 RepID=UPI002A04AC72|nr:ethanolamine utilization protein EutH [Acinetobacter pittii]MDX8237965.1 ethanolamine utilization protein EutH [Acinetobacter pittii]
MEQIGTYIIYIMMFFVAIGAIAAVKDDSKGIGAEFINGIHLIGYLFIPIAGAMASLPYITLFIESVFGPIFSALGASTSMAATSILSVDMGGYQLTKSLADTNENWIMGTINGFLLGPHIVFTIPVALAILAKKDHKYLALGMISGFISIPVALIAVISFISIMNPQIRSIIDTTSQPDIYLNFEAQQVAKNLVPLILLVILFVSGLKFFPNFMIKVFMIFGKIIDSAMKIILAMSIIEYFTGFFSFLFGHWGFSPIIADKEDQFRALEICGYISFMLAGAFPLVYCIQKYLGKYLAKLAPKMGLTSEGITGIIATTANPIILFRLVEKMPPKDKVLTIAFAICGSWWLGDTLAYIANFQPTLIVPLIAGKLVGAIFAYLLAMKLTVPKLNNIGE